MTPEAKGKANISLGEGSWLLKPLLAEESWWQLIAIFFLSWVSTVRITPQSIDLITYFLGFYSQPYFALDFPSDLIQSQTLMPCLSLALDSLRPFEKRQVRRATKQKKEESGVKNMAEFTKSKSIISTVVF